MNLRELLQQAQQMLERLQRELSGTIFAASVGAGMVAVTMNGHKVVLAVNIDPVVLEPDARVTLPTLLAAAFNKAGQEVDAQIRERRGGLTGGLAAEQTLGEPFAGSSAPLEPNPSPSEDYAMNLRQLMKQAQQMQDKLKQELSSTIIESSVGGGVVSVTMNGHKNVLAVRIDPELLRPDELEDLQILIISAVNEASKKVDEEVQSKLGGMAGGLPGMI